MKVIVKKTSEEMGYLAAEIIADEIRKKPNMNLCLPTGSTPVGCLEELVCMHKKEGLDFSQLNSFNMDEYVGLSKEHDQGYYHFLMKYLYQHVNINRNHTYVPDTTAENIVKAAEDYTNLILDKGGFDVILLGIGRDGHISFNMPKEAIDAYTHVEALSKETIEDNARFFSDQKQIPTAAVTIGLKLILDSKKIILIAIIIDEAAAKFYKK